MSKWISSFITGPDFGSFTLAAVFCATCFMTAATAQTANNNSQTSALTVVSENKANSVARTPALKEFRKVVIGMPADAVREAWGKPKIEDAQGFLYEPSDSETVQIALDREKKVAAIAAMFAGGKGAPSIADVFGPGVQPQKQENGSVYHMVRYPEAGYWVSYSAGAGENATVILTIQKF